MTAGRYHHHFIRWLRAESAPPIQPHMVWRRHRLARSKRERHTHCRAASGPDSSEYLCECMPVRQIAYIEPGNRTAEGDQGDGNPEEHEGNELGMGPHASRNGHWTETALRAHGPENHRAHENQDERGGRRNAYQRLRLAG